MRKAWRRVLYEESSLHILVGGLFGAMGLVVLYRLRTSDLPIEYPELALGASFTILVGTLVGTCLVAVSVLRWCAHRRTQHWKAGREFGRSDVYELTISGMNLTVVTDGKRSQSSLMDLHITKYSDMILVRGFSIPLPIPPTADFGDASFAEFYLALKQRR
ncbi:MAG: hypothetical protein KJZ78_14510 [Bryobacteraceae bacterium]|nr:hypothetical protein [Bryobacteraceae bacterium]